MKQFLFMILLCCLSGFIFGSLFDKPLSYILSGITGIFIGWNSDDIYNKIFGVKNK